MTAFVAALPPLESIDDVWWLLSRALLQQLGRCSARMVVQPDPASPAREWACDAVRASMHRAPLTIGARSIGYVEVHSSTDAVIMWLDRVLPSVSLAVDRALLLESLSVRNAQSEASESIAAGPEQDDDSKHNAASPLTRGAPALVERFGLTGRQREVLELVFEGKANKEIAVVLDCTISNVEYLLRRVLEKAHCRSRAELFSLALRTPGESP